MKTLKYFGLTIVIVFGAFALIALKNGGLNPLRCSGLRDCYQASQGIGSDERTQRGAITQFTASAQLAAVPVLLEGNIFGILLVDRETRKLQVLTEPAVTLFAPRFSRDGKRLVLTRREQDGSEDGWSDSREILSCTVADWRCERVAKVDGIVKSPVEIDERTILYVMPLPRGVQDFYAVTAGMPPVRMTQNLRVGSIDAVSVSAGKITFGAFSGVSAKELRAPARSEIYQLSFDAQQLRTDVPPTLDPIVLLDGLSVKPAASADGEHLAFLHTVTGKGKYHYKLAIGDLATRTHQIVDVTGKMISLPAFVGDTVSYVELFNDHYELYDFDLASSQKRKLTEIKFSAIKNAERVTPVISSCGERCPDHASINSGEVIAAQN